MKLNLPESSRVFERKPRFSLAAYLVGQVMKSKSPIMAMPYIKVGYYTNVREYIARKGYPIYTMKVGDQILFFRTDIDIPEVKMPSIDEVHQGDADDVTIEDDSVEYSTEEAAKQYFDEDVADTIEGIALEEVAVPAAVVKSKPVKEEKVKTPIRASDLGKKAAVLKTPVKAPVKTPVKAVTKAPVKGKGKTTSKVASPSITPAADALS